MKILILTLLTLLWTLPGQAIMIFIYNESDGTEWSHPQRPTISFKNLQLKFSVLNPNQCIIASERTALPLTNESNRINISFSYENTNKAIPLQLLTEFTIDKYVNNSFKSSLSSASSPLTIESPGDAYSFKLKSIGVEKGKFTLKPEVRNFRDIPQATEQREYWDRTWDVFAQNMLTLDTEVPSEIASPVPSIQTLQEYESADHTSRLCIYWPSLPTSEALTSWWWQRWASLSTLMGYAS